MIIYLAAITRNARPAIAGHDATIPEDRRTGCPPSVLSCTAWGFSCLANCFASGELLPPLFNLACTSLPKNRRCLFCDTFRQPRLGSELPACFTRHAAVWCSDFPLRIAPERSSAIARILSQAENFAAKPFDHRLGVSIVNSPDQPEPETFFMALAVGTKAPDFSLATKTADGPKQVKLSDNFGKTNTLLLFFPMAFTGTCTQEMCNLSPELPNYTGMNAAVYGISGDNPSAQEAGAKKENLSVTLLSDYERRVANQYDVMYDSCLPRINLGMSGARKCPAF